MSYSLQSITALPASITSQWESPDPATAVIQTLLTGYEKVWLKLTESVEGTTVWLDLKQAQALIQPRIAALTVTAWLASLGSATLPTLTVPPSFELRSAQYAYAWSAGYKAEAVHLGRHPDADGLQTDRNDLLLTKAGVDFQAYGRYLMVTINGLFHRVGGSDEGLYVVDAARSARIANNTHIGIHSFKDVGALDYIPLTPNMLYRVSEHTKYADKIRVELPYSVKNKSVFLVVGGYLHALDGAYQITGERGMVIHTRKLSLPKRILEAHHQINLHNLQLEHSSNNPTQLSVQELSVDRVIVSYLTLPQSFLVVVNQPSLRVHRHSVENARLPGRYITPVQYTDGDTLKLRPKLPLVGDLGRVYDYTAKVCDGVAVLETDHQPAPNYRYETGPWRATTSIDDACQSYWPWSYSRAHLLEIGTYG